MSLVPNQNSYGGQNQGYYRGRGRGSPGQGGRGRGLPGRGGGVKRRLCGRGSDFSGMFVHKSKY